MTDPFRQVDAILNPRLSGAGARRTMRLSAAPYLRAAGRA